MFTYGLCFEFDGEDELSECCKHLVNTYERMESGLDTRTHHVNVYTSAKVIQTPTGPNVKIEVSGLDNAIRLFEEQKKNAEEILQGLKDLAEKAEEIERHINSGNNNVLALQMDMVRCGKEDELWL